VIFVDTSFWIAATRGDDVNHAVARSLIRHHEQATLVTSNLVRGEAWTLLRRRLGHRAAVAFRDCLATLPRLRLVPIDEHLEDEAWSWLRRHDERPYSFVDATSFALMRSLRIRDAFAFDQDFSAAGFVELRP
jgi:predicted nucleic acid-binding protein